MKRVTLLRHAKSSWSDGTLADRDRPLSARGERDAPKMAARLLAREIRPALTLSSPANRALTTATLVTRALGCAEPSLRIEPLLYLADPRRILSVLSTLNDEFDDVMIVGHNPGLTELVNRLLPDWQLDNLATAGVVAIDFHTERWADIDNAATRLAFYDYPKRPEPSRSGRVLFRG